MLLYDLIFNFASFDCATRIEASEFLAWITFAYTMYVIQLQFHPREWLFLLERASSCIAPCQTLCQLLSYAGVYCAFPLLWMKWQVRIVSILVSLSLPTTPPPPPLHPRVVLSCELYIIMFTSKFKQRNLILSNCHSC